MTIEELIAFVETRCDVPPGSIRGRDRHQSVARARQIAAWLIRLHSNPRRSFPEIGRLLGRDHTTIMAACNSVLRRRRTDLRFLRFTDSLFEEAAVAVGVIRVRVQDDAARVA